MNNPQKFVIIDDDAFNNNICKLILHKSLPNADIVDFTSPEEGLSYIETLAPQPQPQYLLLDINMPTMTGWEFLDEYEKLPAQVKQNYEVYILSSSIDERDMERARSNSNVKGYIVKPLKNTIIADLFKHN